MTDPDELCEDQTALGSTQDQSVEKTLANPNHPIYKVMLGLVALLTVMWTQNGSM